MPNLITRREGIVGNPQKASLLVPAFRPPIPRSLVSDGRFKPPVELPLGSDIRGPGEAVPPVAPITVVQDEPYTAWRVDLIALTILSVTWLDDPTLGRYTANRRSVTVTNHDRAFGCWLREISSGVVFGGYLGPDRSISIPLGSLCRVYAQGINPAGQNVSFYQFGTAVVR